MQLSSEHHAWGQSPKGVQWLLVGVCEMQAASSRGLWGRALLGTPALRSVLLLAGLRLIPAFLALEDICKKSPSWTDLRCVLSGRLLHLGSQKLHLQCGPHVCGPPSTCLLVGLSIPCLCIKCGGPD